MLSLASHGTEHRETVSPPPTADDRFCAWLRQASPNEWFAYHRGWLVCDLNEHCRAMPDAQRRAIRRVAKRAWSAAEHGLVHLVQNRHGPGDYSYIAIRAKCSSFKVAEIGL
jgi:hypothetical protein